MMNRYLDPRAIRTQAENYVATTVKGGNRNHVAELLINAYLSAKFPKVAGERLRAKKSELVSETVRLYGKSDTEETYTEYAITRFSVELSKLKFKA